MKIEKFKNRLIEIDNEVDEENYAEDLDLLIDENKKDESFELKMMDDVLEINLQQSKKRES
jgi:hypothetical protein